MTTAVASPKNFLFNMHAPNRMPNYSLWSTTQPGTAAAVARKFGMLKNTLLRYMKAYGYTGVNQPKTDREQQREHVAEWLRFTEEVRFQQCHILPKQFRSIRCVRMQFIGDKCPPTTLACHIGLYATQTSEMTFVDAVCTGKAESQATKWHVP
jgi:hypothetical protein